MKMVENNKKSSKMVETVKIIKHGRKLSYDFLQFYTIFRLFLTIFNDFQQSLVVFEK